MILLGLTGKHVLFISNVDKFFLLYADALLSKVGVVADELVAVVYDSGRASRSQARIPGVHYLDFDPCHLAHYIDAKSLTFMSLLSWNSGIARSLIEHDERVLDRLYVFITDDEVARWDANVRKNGALMAEARRHISDDCIFSLSKIRNFIAPVPYFKNKISCVTGRKDLVFHDASPVFGILPSRSSLAFDGLLIDNDGYDAVKYRVLVGSKGWSWRGFIDVLRSVNGGLARDFQFVVFASSSQRLMIELYLAWRRRFEGVAFNIVFLENIPAVAYSAMVASCTHLVLQRRGGASTARVFCGWGKGTLMIEAGSPNNAFFKDVYKVDFLSFASEKQVVERILHGQVDVHGNSSAIAKEEQRSIGVLAQIYG